jgi:hypothetical protein
MQLLSWCVEEKETSARDKRAEHGTPAIQSQRPLHHSFFADTGQAGDVDT